jgi:hypothetical protein
MRLVGLGSLWTIATFAGFTLATLLGIASFLGISALLGCDVRSVGPLPDPCSSTYYFVLALAALLGGAGLGLTQFAILRLFHLPTSAWWIPATSVGLAIPVSLEIAFPMQTSVLAEMSFFVMLGLSLGIAQWLVLRVRTPRAVIWIAGTVISALVAGLISGWTVGSALSWMVVAAGTALTLISLLRAEAPSGSEEAGA